MVRALVAICALSLLPVFGAASAGTRILGLDDLARLQEVSDPQVSPQGDWVAYTVSTVDSANDKRVTNIWMVSWDGKQRVQLTYSPESEHAPRWSPDGKSISFLSARPGKAKGTQVWVMDRRGGEARQLTEIKGKVQDYVWSPDSRRLAVVVVHGRVRHSLLRLRVGAVELVDETVDRHGSIVLRQRRALRAVRSRKETRRA